MPQTLDSGQSFPAGLLVVGGFVYRSNVNEAALKRVPKEGGATETVAFDEDTEVTTHDASYPYRARLREGTVVKMPLDGSTGPVERAPGKVSDDPRGIAVDGWSVYRTTSQGNAVMKVPIDGGASVELATPYGPGGIAVDAEHVYWVDSASPRQPTDPPPKPRVELRRSPTRGLGGAGGGCASRPRHSRSSSAVGLTWPSSWVPQAHRVCGPPAPRGGAHWLASTSSPSSGLHGPHVTRERPPGSPESPGPAARQDPLRQPNSGR